MSLFCGCGTPMPDDWRGSVCPPNCIGHQLIEQQRKLEVPWVLTERVPWYWRLFTRPREKVFLATEEQAHEIAARWSRGFPTRLRTLGTP